MKTILTATGRYLPEREVTNQELVQFPAEARPLIEQKTGVQARRYAADDQTTSDLGLGAARDCLQRADFPAENLDAIILATSSPDRIHPPSATAIQRELGAFQAFAFDLNAVCSGALFAMDMADGLIRSGKCASVLVVGAEIYSRFLNPDDFSTAPYFGDGAGAVLLQAAPDNEERGIQCGILRSDGRGSELIRVQAGGAMLPADKAKPRDFFFRMNGKEIFKFAVSKGVEVCLECLERVGMDKTEVSLVVGHQANINILKAIADNTGIPFERFAVNLERLGNTAGASVLIALDNALRNNAAQPGDNILLATYGGGLSWAAMLIKL